MDSVEIKIRAISCLRCFSFDLLWFYSCTLECGTPTVQPDVHGTYLRCSPEHRPEQDCSEMARIICVLDPGTRWGGQWGKEGSWK